MFLMRADPLRGQVGGGWAQEISSFQTSVQSRIFNTIWKSIVKGTVEWKRENGGWAKLVSVDPLC